MLLTLLPVLGTLPVGLPPSALGFLPYLITVCFVVFGSCVLEACSFLRGERGAMNWDRVEVWGNLEE